MIAAIVSVVALVSLVAIVAWHERELRRILRRLDDQR